MPVMTLFTSILAGLLAILGVPIAVAIGLSSLVAIWLLSPIPVEALLPILVRGMQSFVLVAIPFFILAGMLMERGGIGTRLVTFSNALFGWARGGLGTVNIVASLLFGGMSGSSVADTVALGSVLIPRMVDEGYDRDYSAAVTATSSVLSVIVPPSILMVVLGVLAEQPVARLLLGGVGPALIVCGALIAVNLYISHKRSYGRIERFTWSGLWQGFRVGITSLLAPLIILGGIASGWVTPTEAAALAVLYTVLVGFFIHRELNLRSFFQTIINAGEITSVTLFIVAGSYLYSWILAWERVPNLLTESLLGLTQSPVTILMIMNLVLLLAGMFLDAVAALIILVPLLFPAALQVGLDPIHVGVVMVGNLAVGLVTPPYGVCLFSTAAVSRAPLGQIVRASLPFYGALIAALILYSYVPGIVTWLPNLVLGK